MNSQKNAFLIILLIGLFLSVCLALLLNSISLPSWLRPLAPLLIIALVALLILVEALKEDTSTPPGRRDFFRSFVVPAGWITLLTIMGGFLTIEEANIEQQKQALDAERTSQLTRLRIGFLPIGNDTTSILNTLSLDDKLSHNLKGIPVTSASVGKTYGDTVQALGEGKIEVAWLGPLSYLYAHQKYGAKVILLRLSQNGQKTYQSYFITRKDSGILTLSDLKGLRFALVDPISTSGSLIPRYELKKADLDPDTDVNCFYADSQEKVIEQVLSGDAPAGAVSSDNYNGYLEKLGHKTSDLTILFKSPMKIPEGPIAVRQDIQLYDTLRVEDAFLTIGEDDPAVLNSVNIGGFVKATDNTYAELLKIAQEMNFDLSTANG